MKDQFVDYETAKMLKELGYNWIYGEALAYYYPRSHFVFEKPFVSATDVIPAFLWQQVEQWLWENHKMYFDVSLYKLIGQKYQSVCVKVDGKGRIRVLFTSNDADSPITAKTEGIKAAIKYLHEQQLNLPTNR